MHKKAQLGISNLIFWVVLVVVLAVITPFLEGVLQEVLNVENNSMARLVIQIIVPFVWLMVLVVLINYTNPQRPIINY